MSIAAVIIGTMFGLCGGIGALGLVLWFKQMQGGKAELGPVVDALRDDVDDTRAQLADLQEHTQAQLADMQERLDFAERLLTASRASQKDSP